MPTQPATQPADTARADELTRKLIHWGTSFAEWCDAVERANPTYCPTIRTDAPRVGLTRREREGYAEQGELADLFDAEMERRGSHRRAYRGPLSRMAAAPATPATPATPASLDDLPALLAGARGHDHLDPVRAARKGVR